MADTEADTRTRLQFTRRYEAPVEKVWRAWTEPQALMRWFGPAQAADFHASELDVRVGGKYHVGFSMADGERNDLHGEFLEIVPHQRLVFSWYWKSTPERVSRVTVLLRAVGDATELDLTHDRFFSADALANHERGWTAALENLAKSLAA